MDSEINGALRDILEFSQIERCRLIEILADKVENELNRGLRSIAEFFDADRSTIGLFSEDGTRLASVFEYRSAEAEPAPESLSKEQTPWYIEKLARGEAVIVNRVDDFPPEGRRGRWCRELITCEC